MALNELCYAEAHEAATLLAGGEVTSVELTEMELARIERLDPRLGSYVSVFADDALASARECDAQIAAGRYRGGWHGIPVAVKDCFDVEGAATMAGMAIRRDHLAERDATSVARLRAAGAVLLGKLHLAEGVYAEYIEPFTAPRNPWDPERWTAASSSGNAVATAAGFCFGSLATETGGSIRLPASATGVTGLKPTWGRVSRHGVFELAASLDHVGPICRSARDAGSMLQVIAGADPADPTSSPEPVMSSVDSRVEDLRGVRLAFDERWSTTGVDAPTAGAVLAAVDTMRGLGATIVPVDFPDPTQMVDDWFGMCAVQTAYAHRLTFPDRRGEYGPALAALLELGWRITGVQYQELLIRRAAFRGALDALLRSVDALVLPTVAFVAPLRAMMIEVDAEKISGMHRFTCPFTMSGHPTLAMPAGYTDEGLPASVQVAGRFFDEATLIRIGTAYQQVTDWHRRHPPL